MTDLGLNGSSITAGMPGASETIKRRNTMKYAVKSKQNLDGVQTLTGDPLVTYQVVNGKNGKRTK